MDLHHGEYSLPPSCRLSWRVDIFFKNFCLAAPRTILDCYWGESLTHPILITAFYLFRPKGHQEPREEAQSLSLAERLAGVELGTFRFQFRLNPFGHIQVRVLFLNYGGHTQRAMDSTSWVQHQNLLVEISLVLKFNSPKNYL